MKALSVVSGDFNLKDYDETCKNFEWKEVEKNFSWSESGKVNIAFEAIDRHALGNRKNKVALYYRNAARSEKYTFKEMMENSNKAGNVLKDIGGVVKGDRVFVFMPRSPEIYFVILGAIKLGAIVGPLFEAFMEGAVKDRLADSEAKVIVTTPELVSRIPIDELPSLEHIFIVGEEVAEEGKFINFNK